MRAFVAVFPPPSVRHALIEAAQTVPHAGFRLTAPQRVHLTLRFLGDLSPEALPRIAAALEPVREGQVPFDAVTTGFGVFPSACRARILWAGVGEGAESLRALAHAVEACLQPEGFAPEDRPFVPHITLGRASRPKPFEPADATLPELRFTVSRVDLVQSKHGTTGVAYSTLASYHF